jgi:hypothetical protein
MASENARGDAVERTLLRRQISFGHSGVILRPNRRSSLLEIVHWTFSLKRFNLTAFPTSAFPCFSESVTINPTWVRLP